MALSVPPGHREQVLQYQPGGNRGCEENLAASLYGFQPDFLVGPVGDHEKTGAHPGPVKYLADDVQAGKTILLPGQLDNL